MRMASEELSPREWAEYNNQKVMIELQMAHAKEMKVLELEVTRLEAKWSSWLKLPVTIIKLPVYVLFGIAFCIAQITKQEMPEQFWRLLR